MESLMPAEFDSLMDDVLLMEASDMGMAQARAARVGEDARRSLLSTEERTEENELLGLELSRSELMPLA